MVSLVWGEVAFLLFSMTKTPCPQKEECRRRIVF